MVVQISRSLDGEIGSRGLENAHEQPKGPGKVLHSILEGIGHGFGATQADASATISAPPTMPLASHIKLLSAHIDNAKISKNDMIQSDTIRARMRRHVDQARKVDDRMSTVHGCLGELDRINWGNEIDARVILSYTTAKHQLIDAQKSQSIGRKLLVAVRALQDLEALVDGQFLEALGLRTSIDSACAAAACFGVLPNRQILSSSAYKAGTSNALAEDCASWIGQGARIPPVALQEFSRRLESALDQLTRRVEEAWTTAIAFDCSSEVKRIITFVDDKTGIMPLSDLCEIFESREELVPRLSNLSAQLLEDVVRPMLEPVRESTCAWICLQEGQEEAESVILQKTFLRIPHEAAASTLQSLNTLLSRLAASLFGHEEAHRRQVIFSHAFLPALIDMCIAYLQSQMPSRLVTSLHEGTIGVLEQLASAARGVYENLDRNSYLAKGLTSQSSDLDVSHSASYNPKRLLEWADSVRTRFLSLLADEGRLSARTLLLSENAELGGWKASQVEFEAEVDVSEVAAEEQNLRWDSNSRRGREHRGSLEIENQSRLEDDAEERSSGSPQPSTAPSKAYPLSSRSPTQLTSGSKGKGRLGGVRIVKPHHQLGSGPLPEVNDDALWGFDDVMDASLSSRPSSSPSEPSLDSSRSRSNPIGRNSSLAVEHEDDAWFAEEGAERSIDPEKGSSGREKSTPASKAEGEILPSGEALFCSGEQEEQEEQEEVDVDEDAWGLSTEERQQLAKKGANRTPSTMCIPQGAQEARETRNHDKSMEDAVEEQTKAGQDSAVARTGKLEVGSADTVVSDRGEGEAASSIFKMGTTPQRNSSLSNDDPAMPADVSWSSRDGLLMDEGVQYHEDEDEDNDAWPFSKKGQPSTRGEEHTYFGEAVGSANAMKEHETSLSLAELGTPSSSACDASVQSSVPVNEDDGAKMTVATDTQNTEGERSETDLGMTNNEEEIQESRQWQHQIQSDQMRMAVSGSPKAAPSSSSSDTHGQDGSDPWGDLDCISIPMSLPVSSDGESGDDVVGLQSRSEEDTLRNDTTHVNSDVTAFAPRAANAFEGLNTVEEPSEEEWTWNDDEQDRKGVLSKTSLSGPKLSLPTSRRERRSTYGADLDAYESSAFSGKTGKTSMIRSNTPGRSSGANSAAPKQTEIEKGSVSPSTPSNASPDVPSNASKKAMHISTGLHTFVEMHEHEKRIGSADPSSTSNFLRSEVKTETCTISQRSIDLIHLCNRLLEDYLRWTSLEQDADASPLIAALVDISDLHRAIMPVSHADTLANVPSLAMQFANDCLYIAKEFGKMRQRLKIQGSQSDTLFDLERQEMLTMLVGRRSFDAQMIMQERILKDCLSDAQGFARVHDEVRFAACERCIKQLLSILQQLSKAWKDVLAKTTYLAAMGKLVDGLLSQVLHCIIYDMDDISEAESEKLADLVRSLGAVENLFKIEEGAEEAQTVVAIFVPTWFKASYLGEILTGSLVDIEFLYFEAKALVDYDTSEIVKLIKSLFADTTKRRQLTDKIESST